MSQPPVYDRAYSFTSYQAANPSLPLPAAQVELEYNRIKATLDAIGTNLALIQSDDGSLARASVGRDQLAADVQIGFDVPTRWATSTAYSATNTVFFGTSFYNCAVAHTSGDFNADILSGKWVLIADFSLLTQNASLITYDNLASGLNAGNAQDALDELASEKLDKAGGALTGSLSMGGNRITGLPTTAAASGNDALSRAAGDLRFQPLDADLTAIAALTTAAYGRALLVLADEAAFKALVNLEIGVDVQAYDANLAAIAALTSAANKVPYATGSGAWALADFTAAGRALVDDADAAAQRTTLGIVAYDVYTGSTAGNLVYPLGTNVAMIDENIVSPATNASQTVKLGTAAGTFSNGSGLSSLTGTWRNRGYCGVYSTFAVYLFQRTA